MNEMIVTEICDALNGHRKEDKARFFGLALDENNVLVAKQLAEHGDIYDMIDGIHDDKIVENSSFQYYAFITYGWAAPLNENGEPDGQPSKHPQKRRVRLVISVNPDDVSVGSALEFEDSPDDIVFDFGSATGSLNDAILSLF